MDKEESLQGILITVLYLVKCGTFKAWGELVCKKTHILHVFANLGFGTEIATMLTIVLVI